MCSNPVLCTLNLIRTCLTPSGLEFRGIINQQAAQARVSNSIHCYATTVNDTQCRAGLVTALWALLTINEHAFCVKHTVTFNFTATQFREKWDTLTFEPLRLADSAVSPGHFVDGAAGDRPFTNTKVARRAMGKCECL